MKAATPVTAPTGFLGRSRSTLGSQRPANPRFAGPPLTVNEVGTVDLDSSLIRCSAECSVETTMGCLCCPVPGKKAIRSWFAALQLPAGGVDAGPAFVGGGPR